MIEVAPIEIADPLPDVRDALTLASAELAECTCPDWCERDHDLD